MGIFSRRQPAGRPGEPSPAPDPEVLEYARTVIRPGFVDRNEAVVAVRDHFEIPDDDRRPEAAVEAAWRARQAEQPTWREVGDYDRLAAAFARVKRQGLVALMNFTCCQGCATGQIEDERTPLRRPEPGEYPFREWAYTFFHQQDAQRLAESPAVLHLTYGAFRSRLDLVDPDLAESAAIGDPEARRTVKQQTDAAAGRIVAAALREHDLDVDWDGDPSRRIAVRITEWHKYLPV